MIKRPPRSRSGSIYLITLATALIVAILGLAALLSVRIERRQISDEAADMEAELLAARAVDMALLRIEQDPDWRQRLAAGQWESDQSAGSGTYSFQGIDPDDGDLTNLNTDPVVITGTGKSGEARQKVQVRLEAETPPLGCLEVSLHAGGDLIFTTATVNSDQIISANGSVTATAATVNADVEAAGTISGGSYLGTQTPGISPRSVPDPAAVFDFYTAEGTPILISSLPTVGGIPTIGENVIGPGYNPYGSQTVNPNGIYVIDCQGQDIQIRDSRILGTLVLLNAGSGSTIYNSVNWEPAVANYPALLFEGTQLNLVYTNTPLSETAVGQNLNPPGAPYQGAEDPGADPDPADTYPSVIKGIVYASGDVAPAIDSIPISYSETIYVTIDGVLVVGNTLDFNNGATLELTYQAAFLGDPPPGFREAIRMKIAPGTWQKVVD